MIGKTVYENGRVYLCDRCKIVVVHFKSHKAAKAAGWAISRDYTKCYCPACAPLQRNTGRGGARAILPPGRKQIAIDLK